MFSRGHAIIVMTLRSSGGEDDDEDDNDEDDDFTAQAREIHTCLHHTLGGVTRRSLPSS